MALPYGVFDERDLPDGRSLHVLPLLFARARLCVGPKDSDVYEDVW